MTKDELIELINHTVYENEDGDITGEVMNLVLNAIVATIGVEANPDDEATGTLTKIKIGEEVFDVEGGGGTVDPYPTEGSTNPVQSGGVYEALENKVDSDNLYVDLGITVFDASAYYNINDLVFYDGNIYRFTDVHSGPWNGNDVVLTDLYSYLKFKESETAGGITYLDNIKIQKVLGATANNFASFVGSTGSLKDSGKKASDFATAEQGALADTAYQKPSGGIPKTDLASGVQTSLGKADTAFQKPSGGIPASDLAAAVQTSLGKADTALQSYTETDPVFSASPAAGITSGDIADWDDKADPIPVVDASTIPASMDADKVYQYGTLSGDTTFPALATPSDLTVAHVYCWTFATPSTAPTITWPVAITSWAGGAAPTINASKSYEVSVMDGLATIIEA